MKKHILSLLLILTMLFACSMTANAADTVASGTCGKNLTWTLDSDGVLTISGSGHMDDHYLRDVPWADYRSEIKSVVLPDGLTSIGTYAFSDCTALTAITIPEQVKEIGIRAFFDCTALEEIRFNATAMKDLPNVNFVFSCAGNDGDGIAVTIGSGVTRIPACLFAPWYYGLDYAPNIVSVEFAEDGLCTEIGGYAFAGCENITAIKIPETVASIGEMAFYDCAGLKTIAYNAVDLQGITAEHNVFEQAGQGIALSIGENVTGLPDHLFSGANITSVTFAGDKCTQLGEAVFSGCTGLTSIDIPDGVSVIRTNTFSGCTGLTEVALPTALNTIETGAFSGCTGLKQLTIPDGTVSIGHRAFYYCTGLSKVTIPESVVTIGNEAFAGCAKLTAAGPIGGGYAYEFGWREMIPGCAFQGCTGLTAVTIPATVTDIGYSAFYGCTKLTAPALPDGLEYIGYHAFYNCTKLTSLTLPESVQEIGGYAFYGCTALTELTLPGDVYWIGESAFRGCTALAEVTVGEGVQAFDDYVFRGCTALSKVTFLGDAPAFRVYDFQNVTAVCYYPGDNSTWTSAVMQNYGGTLTWTAYCTEHTPVADPAVAPTCSETGLTEGSHCAVCGTVITKQQVVPTVAHTEVAVPAIEPTCTQTGLGQGKQCSVCGTVTVKQPEVPAKGHTYENGLCVRCGKAEAAITRIAGEGRCETAIEAANTLKTQLGIAQFDYIIMASGSNFADALAGSYLAAVRSAPILLYRDTAVELNRAYILENLTGDGIVYLLGGDAAVPESVEADLVAAGITVKRLAGATRYDTNIEILKEADVSAEQELLVATGLNFADSLSASATGLPILLVNNRSSVLTDSQTAYLESLGGNPMTILGGDGAVGEELADALSDYGAVDRVAGNTRYDTSVMIAERYFPNADTVVVAYGRNFPDGLSGGPVAYTMGAPLLLTQAGSEAAAAAYVAENGIRRAYILGGTGAVSESTVELIFGQTTQ